MRAVAHLSEKDDTRSQLISAARDLYLESGPLDFSLREVARRVGVSAPAVYRHFEGKDDLLAAACTQGFLVFSSYLVRALAEATPRARLLSTGDQYRRFALENPTDYRFIFMTSPLATGASGPKGPKPGAHSGLPQDSTFRLLVDRVKECIEARVLGKGNPDEMAIFIWAHVHGLVSLRLSGKLDAVGSDDAFADFYRASVAKLLKGLAP